MKTNSALFNLFVSIWYIGLEVQRDYINTTFVYRVKVYRGTKKISVRPLSAIVLLPAYVTLLQVRYHVITFTWVRNNFHEGM